MGAIHYMSFKEIGGVLFSLPKENIYVQVVLVAAYKA